MAGRVTTGPSGNVDAGRTDVTDPDALRQELIRIAEDADADDYETMEGRISSLLSDTRRALPDGGDA